MAISQMWLIFICIIVGLLSLVVLAFIVKTFLCKKRNSDSNLRKSSSFFEAVSKKSDQSLSNKSQEKLAVQVEQLGKSHQRLAERLDNIERQLSDDTYTFSSDSETRSYDEKYRKVSEMTINPKQILSEKDKANLTTISKALDSTFWKDESPTRYANADMEAKTLDPTFLKDESPTRYVNAEVLSSNNKASEEKIDIEMEPDDNDEEAVETLEQHLEKLENIVDKKRRAGLKTL